MGRKQSANPEGGARGWLRVLRYTAVSLAALAAIALVLAAVSRLDQFLAEDPRFRLAPPAEETGLSPALISAGASHVAPARIAAVFAGDYGRSIYLLPLDERRRSLLAIDWVKDASVSRLWSGRVAVRSVERTPVAFVHLPGTRSGQAGETALIDAEGVLLAMPARGRLTLPVLAGIRREQDPALRRRRGAVALRLLKEASGHAADFSEIDVSDPENVRVIQAVEGRAVALMLGTRNFETRLRNFLNHYPEIHRRLPNAMQFDLRLDDRITAIEEGGRGG
jgi:cell division protein FtsQ